MFRSAFIMALCGVFFPITLMGQTSKASDPYVRETLSQAEVGKVITIGRRVVDRVGEASSFLVAKNDSQDALGTLTKALVDLSFLKKRSLAYKQTYEMMQKKGLIKKAGGASISVGKIPLHEDLSIHSSLDAVEDLENNSSSPVMVGTTFQDVRRVLDLNIAEKKLHKAVRLLRNNKTNEAIEVLQSFYGEAVFYEIDSADFPLYNVAQNLMLAKVALEEGDDHATEAALMESVEALEAYEEVASADIKDDVVYLKKVIQVRADVISEEPDRGAELVQTWWDKVVDWSHAE